MFHYDQSYTKFCGLKYLQEKIKWSWSLGTYDDKMFSYKETFNKTCNWIALRAVKPDIKRQTSH